MQNLMYRLSWFEGQQKGFPSQTYTNYYHYLHTESVLPPEKSRIQKRTLQKLEATLEVREANLSLLSLERKGFVQNHTVN